MHQGYINLKSDQGVVRGFNSRTDCLLIKVTGEKKIRSFDADYWKRIRSLRPSPKGFKTYDKRGFRIKIGDPVTLCTPYEGSGKIVNIHRKNIVSVKLSKVWQEEGQKVGKVGSQFVSIDLRFLKERK
jgi:hypothetical protein